MRILKTKEDVLKIEEGEKVYIHHPITDVLILCKVLKIQGDWFIKAYQHVSWGLRSYYKEHLATSIINKTFRLELK